MTASLLGATDREPACSVSGRFGKASRSKAGRNRKLKCDQSLTMKFELPAQHVDAAPADAQVVS